MQWREDGRLPIDCIADDTRHILDIHQYLWKSNYSKDFIKEQGVPSWFPTWRSRICADFDEKLQGWDDLVTPEQHIQCGINYLDDTIEDLYNYIPRWLGQENYVEKFVEKDAVKNSIRSILNKGDPLSEYKDTPRHVIVVPNKGWTSYTFVRKNLDRLLHQQKQGKKVHVQYYGDSDPSGERMTAEDSKLLKLLNKHNINFECKDVREITK